MLTHRWKVILLVVASVAAGEPSRALTLYQKPYKNVMFIPKNYYRRRSRVLFLDEDENHQPYGKGEIDLTLNSKIKFDETTDYEFTSPDENAEVSKIEDTASGNERFYEPMPRFRPYQNQPQYYHGRFGHPYAPNFNFEPFQTYPALRNGHHPGWKARSPRVVFPYATDNTNSVQTNSHAGPQPVFNDNVVFRDQFSSNDVVEDHGLQDLGGGDSIADRGK